MFLLEDVVATEGSGENQKTDFNKITLFRTLFLVLLDRHLELDERSGEYTHDFVSTRCLVAFDLQERDSNPTFRHQERNLL
jgi:hypothetical protein